MDTGVVDFSDGNERKMKKTRRNLLLFFLWVSANLIALAAMSYREREEIRAKGVDPDLVGQFESLTYQISTPVYKTPFPFHARLLKPDVVEEQRQYPLIVFLHGAGERGHDNLSQLKSLPQQMAQPDWREQFPCYLLAPQCPPKMRWSSSLRSERQSKGLKKRNMLDQVHQMILDVSEMYPVDKQRIYITGYSMGGYGTWSMIACYPNLFAAASPICGGGDPNTVSKFVDLPLWVVHGDADQTIPVLESRKMIEGLRKAGGTPEYHELEGVRHDSWGQAYSNDRGLISWMFAKKLKIIHLK